MLCKFLGVGGDCRRQRDDRGLSIKQRLDRGHCNNLPRVRVLCVHELLNELVELLIKRDFGRFLVYHGCIRTIVSAPCQRAEGSAAGA